MESVRIKSKSFLEKTQLYFENYPGRCCDVSFVVGDGKGKEVIQTSRIILEIACPEFIKLFDEKWGQGVACSRDQDSEINGIPLPDISPRAFKIFLKILIVEDMSVNSLKEIDVPSEDILNVIELCREFKMSEIQQNLEAIAEETLFGNGFSAFANSDGFLALSKSNLNTVLLSEKLHGNEMEILDATIRWAEKQCSELEMESTGENIREVLGDSLFNIRFLSMTHVDFGSHIRLQSILTKDEQLEIFRYLSAGNESFSNPDIGRAINKVRQGGNLFAKVRVTGGHKIVNYPSFECCGKVKQANRFKVDQKIQLYGVGFLGPIESDSFYDVTVDVDCNTGRSCGKLKTRVLAKKNEIFYVFFDQPITLKATYTKGDWNGGYYFMMFGLKGSNTQSPSNTGTDDENFRIETPDGIAFYYRLWNSPLVELCYKKC